MKTIDQYVINPELDLVLERWVDIAPELVWMAWTQPEHVKAWFCPRPWQTIDCRIDLRPGGEFYSVMRSPEGQEFPNVGCYLETVENRKLVWTAALKPGYRPVEAATNGADMLFTAVILLEPENTGTRYTAIAIHCDAEGKQKHEQMGFHDGWSTVLDQLVEYMADFK